MKKALMILFSMAVLSCSNDKVEFVDPHIESDRSMIEELEIQGIKLFKRDIIVKDKSGMNEIILQFAAESEEVLDHYMGRLDVGLSVFKTKVKRSDLQLDDQELQETSSSEFSRDYNSKDMIVYQQILSKKFENEIEHFSLSYSFRKSSARTTDGWSLSHWQESNVHDNWMKVTIIPMYPIESSNSIMAAFKYRKSALSLNWKDDGEYILQGGGPTKRNYYRSGERRLAVRVSHNYYNFIVEYGTI